MIDYRFYKLYQKYLKIESVDAVEFDRDIQDLKSSADTRQDLFKIKNDIKNIIRSFDFIQKMPDDPMKKYKISKDKKSLMDKLYDVAIETFEFLKEKRQNIQEEFIFRDLYEKINDISQYTIDNNEEMLRFKKSIVNLMGEIDNYLNRFHRSFFTGNFSYESEKYQKPKLDW